MFYFTMIYNAFHCFSIHRICYVYMFKSEQDRNIKRHYFDPSEYGNIETTLADAREMDNSNKLDEVQQWFDNHIQQQDTIILLTCIGS